MTGWHPHDEEMFILSAPDAYCAKACLTRARPWDIHDFRMLSVEAASRSLCARRAPGEIPAERPLVAAWANMID